MAPAPDFGRVLRALPGATAVFATDAPHYTVLEASDVLLAVSGRPRDAVIGRPLAQAFPNASPDDPDARGLTDLRASIAAAVATGAPQRMARQRFDLPRPDGTWEARYWDALNLPVLGSDGRVAYVLHQTEEVTALVRGEAEREAARALGDLERRRLLAVLEQLPVGVHVAEAPSGRLVLDNAAVRAICGEAPRSERAADYSADYAGHYPAGHPRAGEALASDGWPLARALATGEAVRDELVEIRRADGTRRLASISAAPVRDVDGRVIGGVATSVDVTAREAARAEAEAARASVAESEAKFRFALAVADLGAWDLDLATHQAWRSPRHDQIFGYDALLPEWSYAQFLAHVVPEDRARVDAAFGGALAAAAPWDFICRIRRADDAERWISARGEPIRDAAGAPVRLVGVVQDVTARYEAEAALRAAAAAAEAARREAEAASRAKSEFLAVMSHELRTPLNAIGGYAELMELGIRGPITAEQRADLARIQQSQRHLLGLINEVLNYARLESGAVQYAITDVPVCDALTAAEGLVAPQARTKGLVLTIGACPTTLAVRADPDKLRQVLLNLLSNAVKFTDRGGAVVVECVRAGGERAGGVAGRDAVAIRVRDTGLGIPADKLAAVFEPFVQVRADLTRPHEGAGLGLAISRDLARGMGGDLTAESTPGAGSTFTLTLPAVP